MVLSAFRTAVRATWLGWVATFVFAGIALLSDWLFCRLLAASLDDRVQYALLRVCCYVDVICQGFLRNEWLSRHILQQRLKPASHYRKGDMPYLARKSTWQGRTGI